MLLEIAAGLGDLVLKRFRQREVLEQRDDVGKGLVKREDVRIGRLAEPAVQAIEQRMRRLVRDDVVRDAVKTTPPGSAVPGIRLER